jgi:hypothetical protein
MESLSLVLSPRESQIAYGCDTGIQKNGNDGSEELFTWGSHEHVLGRSSDGRSPRRAQKLRVEYGLAVANIATHAHPQAP